MTDHPAGLPDRWFDRLPAPLWVVDDEDRTIHVNPATVEALGYTAEEIRGRSPAEFLTEDSQETYRAQSILRRSGLSDSVNLVARTKSGQHRAFRITGAPIFDGDRYVGKIAILRDVAVWNAVENAVREANEEVLADLRAGTRGSRELAHDLRDPLQAIAGCAGLLLEGGPGPLNPGQAEQVRMIAAAARDALERLGRAAAERPRGEAGQDD